MTYIQPVQMFTNTNLRFGYAFPSSRRSELAKALEQLDHRSPKIFGGSVSKYVSILSTRLPVGQIHRLMKIINQYCARYERKIKSNNLS